MSIAFHMLNYSRRDSLDRLVITSLMNEEKIA